MENKNTPALGSLFDGSGEASEHWKPIREFEGTYLVSCDGRVMDSISGNMVREHLDKDGYHIVRLKKGRHYFSRRVHRLVAEAFIPNDGNKPTVNHIDENKDNNDVSNLEWASYKEQVNHGTRSRRAMETIDSESVLQMDVDGNVINAFESVRDAARHINVKPETIIRALKKRSITACGYQWDYQYDRKRKNESNKPTGVLQMDLDGNIVAKHRSIRSAATGTQKMIKDGQLVIIRDAKTYNVLGTMIK